MAKWTQHRTFDAAEDNVAQWASLAIRLLATKNIDTRARWLAADAGKVLRGIAAADMSVASIGAKNQALSALRELGLQA